MFNPMQSQAAIQNPVRFPDQKLQQYAAGNPPQPTGQVTPPMAGQELAQRGPARQAFQNQEAMQSDPKNSPTIYQQLLMKEQMVNQQAQMMQQKEQQLGMAGAMLAKKAQDIAQRERGIAALSIRPDMFTAMNGGIVFRQGGGVQGFKNGGEMDPPGMGESPYRSTPPIEADIPNTNVPSTTGNDAPTIAENLALMRKKLEIIDKAERDAFISKEEADASRAKLIAEMQKEYEEYTQGRSARQQKMEAALRGRDPTPADFFLAISGGGPGRTLGETISRMVPGATKLRAEQEARQMAAAKYAAEAEEKAAQADLAERRGQRDAAARLRKEEQDLRYKKAESEAGNALKGIQALTSINATLQAQQREATRQRELTETTAREERNRETDYARNIEKEGRDRKFKLELLALENKYRRENKEPEFREKLFNIANDPVDPKSAMAKELLFERRGGAGADGRPTYSDYQSMVQKRLEEMTTSERTKLEKQNPGKTARQLIQQEVREELEFEFGKDLFKGQGSKGATPSAKTPPPIGTIMEGYKFKGGDPSKKENWEKV
jgi:hypothetical protein